MEERLADSAPKPLPLETYVVHFPRDQIYRVPPPEHALKIEEHKRIAQNNEANARGALFSVIVPIVLLSILAGVLFMTIRATLYSPTAPEFSVAAIRATDLGKSPAFKATIKVKNANSRMSVSYKGAGKATLIYKNKEIGKGKIEGRGTTADLAAVLAGNGVTPEMKKSLTDEREKLMGLRFELTVEIKSWAKNEGMDLTISCDFRVLNSLLNVTEISFSECLQL